MKILVLECSTASAKAMVFDQEKGILNCVIRSFDTDASDTQSHQMDKVLDTLLKTGNKAAVGHEIDIVSICCTWHSLLVLDQTYHPKTPCFTWGCTMANEVTREIEKQNALSQGIYEKTGCVVHSMYPLYKIMHLAKQGLSIKDCLFTDEGGYLFTVLTGEFVTSRTTAAGSSMMNIHTLEWDREILDLAGIQEQQLPMLVDFEYNAPIKKEMAALLGVKEGTLVVVPSPDGALNQVGACALNYTDMTMSVGTSAAIRMVVDRPAISEDRSTWCYYAPGHWLGGAAISGACNCVNWFVQRFCSGMLGFAQLEGRQHELSDHLPVFLPFLYSERCPGWRDERLGSFQDIRAEHGVADMYFAILEGVLMNLYQSYEKLTQVVRTPQTIKLSGGILKSRVWTQMAADIFQREMLCCDMEQASMLGAAAVGLYSYGALDTLQSFDFKTRSKVVQPDRTQAQYYKERYDRYLYWYQKTIEG